MMQRVKQIIKPFQIKGKKIKLTDAEVLTITTMARLGAQYIEYAKGVRMPTIVDTNGDVVEQKMEVHPNTLKRLIKNGILEKTHILKKYKYYEDDEMNEPGDGIWIKLNKIIIAEIAVGATDRFEQLLPNSQGVWKNTIQIRYSITKRTRIIYTIETVLEIS